MPKSLLTALTILSLLFVAPLAFALTKLVWQSEGIIFSDPTINNVEVIQLTDGRFRMYYHQGPSTMKSAISTDGKTFTPESGTRLAGSMPALIKLPDGRYRMYFKSGKGIFKSALSKDGLSWQIESGNRLTSGGQFDPDDIAHPTVVALPEGGYRMYYDGEVRQTEQEFTWRVLSATSTDGLSFVKDEGARLDVGVEPLLSTLSFSAHALYENGQYLLYFSAQREGDEPSGIYLASSENGLTFTVQQEPLLAVVAVINPGEIPDFPQDPFVLEAGGEKRMYYWSTSGIFSAIQVEQDVEEPKPFWQESWDDFVNWVKGIRNLDLGDAELFIIPGILLTSAAVLLFLFLRYSKRRHH